MPPDYLFTGWFAFVLLGPQGLSKVTLETLSADPAKTPKKGRAAIRASDAAFKDEERKENVGGTGVYNRGTSIKDKCISTLVPACVSLKTEMPLAIFENLSVN